MSTLFFFLIYLIVSYLIATVVSMVVAHKSGYFDDELFIEVFATWEVYALFYLLCWVGMIGFWIIFLLAWPVRKLFDLTKPADIVE